MSGATRTNWPFPVAPTLPAESSIETSEREAVHIGGGIHRVPELEAAIEAGEDVRDAETELVCAEEVLDAIAAQLNLQRTHFDCIGDYIKAVVSEVAVTRDARTLTAIALITAVSS